MKIDAAVREQGRGDIRRVPIQFPYNALRAPQIAATVESEGAHVRAAKSTAHDHHITQTDRGSDRSLGLAGTTPKLLAGLQIVGARTGLPVHDDLRNARVLHDQRRGPAGRFIPLRLPDRFARAFVQRMNG